MASRSALGKENHWPHLVFCGVNRSTCKKGYGNFWNNPSSFRVNKGWETEKKQVGHLRPKASSSFWLMAECNWGLKADVVFCNAIISSMEKGSTNEVCVFFFIKKHCGMNTVEHFCRLPVAHSWCAAGRDVFGAAWREPRDVELCDERVREGRAKGDLVIWKRAGS